MNRVHLIFTTHKLNGICNSESLLKIIEAINPDVIFEELSNENFEKIYNSRSLVTLESTAIKMFLLQKNIDHLPVDTFKIPENYYEKVDFMYDNFFNCFNIKESNELKVTLEDKERLVESGGFHFLNSSRNDEIFNQIDSLKKCILNKINDDELFAIAELEKEVLDKRENKILKNIYNYGINNAFKDGLLLMGSGHRRALAKKIGQLNENEIHKINWTFHNA